MALQAVKAAGQRVAQLETTNAELRASNRQLVQQVLLRFLEKEQLSLQLMLH